MGLNVKQARFVQEYLLDGNAKQAAIRAGYSAATAEQSGSRAYRTKAVREAIDAAEQARAVRVGLTQDDVLRVLKRHLNADPRQAFDENGRLLPVHQLPDDVALSISALESEELNIGDGHGGTIPIGQVRKVKWWSKDKALELAMRHLGMLKDRVEHEVGPGLAELVAGSMKGGGK